MSSLCLAIDGGTTNTRATFLDGHTPAASARRSVGARDVAREKSAHRLAEAVSLCIDEVLKQSGAKLDDVEFIAASGMLTSNVGLLELPHLSAPASMDDLAAAVETRTFPEICAKPIHFVRGIRVDAEADDKCTPGDMMRGEEAETFGLLTLLRQSGPAQLLLPGSHTKLVRVDEQGRIAAIRTSLTGETIDALARNTVLASSVADPLPARLDEKLLEQGAQWAGNHGLLHAAFGVRLAQVLRGRSAEECAALLVGAVVAADIHEMVRSQALDAGLTVFVAGGSAQRAIYAQLLQSILAKTPLKVHPVDETYCQVAAAVGATEIVRRRLDQTLNKENNHE